MSWGARHAGTAVAGFARAHCRSDSGWNFDARRGRAVFGKPILGDQVDGAVSRDPERGAGPLWWTAPLRTKFLTVPAHCAKALLDAVDHHVADHLAGNTGRRGNPADDFAVVAIEGEGEAHDLAVPAGELQAIRAPADIRAQRGDLTVHARAIAGVRCGVQAKGHASSSSGRHAWR
jgi:hypothetical protein